MSGYRINSVRGQVRFVFEQHGETAARAKAVELGVEHKLKFWYKLWGEKAPQRTNGKTADMRRRVRVAECPREPAYLGTVINEGPAQCEVQMDNGTKRIWPTAWLITQQPKSKRDE